MNTLIIKYLADLMYERECVIIPEFGAFISNECPARLDYAAHRFTPSSKEFAFNVQLVSDDGVFVSYLSEKQHITRDKATSALHDFAMQCLARLEVEKELELEGVGHLYYIDNQNVTFVANPNINFCGDAFGLTVFTAQPIYRSEIFREVQTNIAEQQKAKNTPLTVLAEENVKTPYKITRLNYKWYRAAAYSAIVATAMVLLGWGAGKKDSNFAAWNPFFYPSPNEFIVKHLNDNINARETFIVDGIKSVELQSPVFENNFEIVDKQEVTVENELLVNQETIVEKNAVVDTRIYSIIGASLDNLEAAEKCAETFRKLGFENATVLPLNRKGTYRVEYEAVQGKDAAVARLDYIKENIDESAWLFIKK